MRVLRASLLALLFALVANASICSVPDAKAAGTLTLPSSSSTVNSWFDHQPPFGCFDSCTDDFVKYTGERWPYYQANLTPCGTSDHCYNGHNGIDFQLSSGSNVVAAAGGVVTFVGWQNPNDHRVGFGFYVRVWHSGSGYSTLYGHLSEQYLVSVNQTVSRGALVAVSDNTGASTGAYLHFGVYNAQTGGSPIDPYGWSAAGSDPWSADIGWLWSTYPPSSQPAYAIPILPGDYNGNGSEDTGVWRPNACCGSPDPGMWHIYQQFSAQWGLPTDIPVPGDWDSDSSDDVAVYRPSTGYWYFKDANLICGSAGCGVQFGAPGDIPVPGDYNGDGKDEVVVWRSAPRPDLGQPEGGYWLFRAGGQQQWGRPEDFPVPGDYDADPNTDIAVWRPLPYGVYSEGMWWFKQTNSICGFSSPCGVQWGTGSDIPLPGVFSGDLKDDVVVWRPSNGYWYFKQQNYVCGSPGCGVQWGTSTDIPVPFDSNGDQFDEVIVWRPSTGVWWFRGPIAPCGPATPCGVQWGTAGDIPLAGRLRR